jgi:hypothetical protein
MCGYVRILLVHELEPLLRGPGHLVPANDDSAVSQPEQNERDSVTRTDSNNSLGNLVPANDDSAISKPEHNERDNVIGIDSNNSHNSPCHLVPANDDSAVSQPEHN